MVTLEITAEGRRINLSSKKLTEPASPIGGTITVIRNIFTPTTGFNTPVYIYPVDDDRPNGDAEVSIYVKATSKWDKSYDNLTAETQIIVRDDDQPHSLDISCSGTAICHNDYTNTSKCTLKLQESDITSILDQNMINTVMVYCSSDNVSFGTDQGTFELTKANNFQTTISPLVSKQCNANQNANQTATDNFTCHAEASGFYALGKGNLHYLYDNP
jgi:hypothetical protein